MNLNEAYNKAKKVLDRAGYAHGRIDSRVLLCHALGISSEYLYAHGKDREMTEKEEQRFDTLLRLRLARVPVAYITGCREFMGLEFEVDESVLIPRPATETLVEFGLKYLEYSEYLDIEKPLAADVCCGSGNISIALAYYNPDVRVYASDISIESLQTARKNIDRFETLHPERDFHSRIHLLPGNLMEPFPTHMQGEFDLILSNPPYVTQTEWEGLMEGVRMFEPKTALVPPDEPEIFYTMLASQAYVYLKDTGLLAVEIGSGQGNLVQKIFRRIGFNAVDMLKDFEGFDRVVYSLKKPLEI